MPSSYGALVAAAANNCTSDKATEDECTPTRLALARGRAGRTGPSARAWHSHVLRLAQRKWRRLPADGELELSARAPVHKEFCERGRRRPTAGGEEGATGWRGAGGLAGGAQRTASGRARLLSAHRGSPRRSSERVEERLRLVHTEAVSGARAARAWTVSARAEPSRFR